MYSQNMNIGSFPVLVTWVNFQSLGRFVAIVQVVASAAKLLAMAIIIIAGFYLLVFEGTCYFIQDVAFSLANSNQLR